MDNIVFNQIKTSFTEDYGRQLENAVYMYLRRKFNEIYYFNKGGECDFVILNKGKVFSCIQVCYKVDDMNMKREINGLKSAMNFFGINEGVIITNDQSDLFETDGIKISLVPAWKFMV